MMDVQALRSLALRYIGNEKSSKVGIFRQKVIL